MQNPLLSRQTLTINEVNDCSEMSILSQQRQYNYRYSEYNREIQKQADDYRSKQMTKSAKQVMLVDDLRTSNRGTHRDTVELTKFKPSHSSEISVQQILENQRKTEKAQSLRKRIYDCYDSVNFLPLIQPTSSFYIAWKLFIGALILSFFFIIPVFCVYGKGILSDFFSYDIMTGMEILALMLFSTDILVQFNTAYYRRGELITWKSKIATHYLTNLFIFDLISLVSLTYFTFTYQPYEVSIQVDWVDETPDFTVIESGRSWSIVHLLFYTRVVSLFQINELCEELLEQKHYSSAMFRLFKIIILLLFIIQMVACCFYAAGLYSLKKRWQTWLNYDGDFGYIGAFDVQTQYFFSVYFAFTNMTMMCYGDILPMNKLEVVIAMLAMLCAVLLFALNIQKIHETVEGLNEANMRYKRNIKAINRFMRYRYVTSDTQQKVKQYLVEYHIKEGRRELDVEQEVLSMLGPSLRETVYYEAYRYMLEKIPLFQKFSQEFQRKLAAKVQELRCAQDEIVFLDESEAYKGESIYFIADGSIRLFMNSAASFKDQEVFLAKLKSGEHFGEYSFITGQPRQCSAQCQRYSQLLRISRDDFIETMQEFPNDYQIYCMIRDQMMFDSQYYGECFTCGSEDHQAKYCAATHYVPLKEEIIRNYSSQMNQRQKIHRKRNKKRSRRLIVNDENELQKSQHEHRTSRLSRDYQNNQEVHQRALSQIGQQWQPQPPPDYIENPIITLQVPPQPQLMMTQNHRHRACINFDEFDKCCNYEYYYPSRNLSEITQFINR